MHYYIATFLLCILIEPCWGQNDLSKIVAEHQYDLEKAGKEFLVKESKTASLFLLGELHGEQEIPDLLSSIWRTLNDDGYRYIAAEVSPWAAKRLEFPKGNDTLPVEGLWTRQEAEKLRSKGASIADPTIWGCDMEEISLGSLMRELAEANPTDRTFKQSLDLVKGGYSRNLAPGLLSNFQDYQPQTDISLNGTSLYSLLVHSLKIDSARALPNARLLAQIRREALMKDYFLHYYRQASRNGSNKILVRFGRNHLHRGFDDRGISTLGNFLSEFAIIEGISTFSVAAFASGGKYSLLNKPHDADEREYDAAFRFLSDHAKSHATVFDLRPLRVPLRQIKDRTAVQERLLFWANSYDAIICFQRVTPIGTSKAD